MKKKLWWLLVGACMGIFPYLKHLAFLERGYKAYGGELFVFFLPAIAWLMFGSETDGRSGSNDT